MSKTSIGMSSLKGLVFARNARTKRQSSWDRTGGNYDAKPIEDGTTAVIAEMSGAGCITHIWVTVGGPKNYLRGLILRAYWDGEESPSINCPLGDFFNIGHGIARPFSCIPFNMTGGSGKFGDNSAMNCYFQMPYGNGARLEIVNETGGFVPSFYYYVDYEEYDQLDEDALRFHAFWKRENPTDGLGLGGHDAGEAMSLKNLDGAGNYVILEAEGKGHYVGCNLSVDNLEVGEKAIQHNPTGEKQEGFDWWGEGDDMIFIDGEGFPPSLHGTGSEDYFCNAWGMQAHAYPYAGTTLYENDPEFPDRRKLTAYRFHIEDPVIFQKSIKVTIEHGHANHQGNDYASTAYWYQAEPHKPLPPIPPLEDRLPRPDAYMPE